MMQTTDRGPQSEQHNRHDDEQHEEEPSQGDALAHTEMDWADDEHNRAATRDEVRREHDRRAEDEA